MNVDSILISDYAQVVGGKLTVVGVFNTVKMLPGQTLPARLQSMFVSLVIHGHPSELGKKYPLKLMLLNQHRETVAEVTGEFEFPAPDREYPGIPLRTFVIFPLFGPAFEAAGPYAWEVYIDSTYHAGAAFYIEEPENPTA